MRRGALWAEKLGRGLVRCLLALYPASFRQDVGTDLVQDFTARAASRWRGGGPAGFAVWWVRSAASLLANAGAEWLDELRQLLRAVAMTDIRDAFRTLRATPLITAVAILSLALAMGANTAIFSIVDSLVLRPLPVPQADRLALVAGDDDWYSTWWTNPIWEAIRDRSQLFDGAFAYGATRFDLSSGGRADFVDGLRASGRMFEVLGVNAIVGRTFTEADDRRDAGSDGAVVVISYAFWQSRFNGARDVIGRSITLDRVPFTIVGVTPPSFFGPDVGRTFDVAVPLGALAVMGHGAQLDSRTSWWLHVMVRLRRGQTLGSGAAALRALQTQIAEETRPTDQRPQEAAAHLTAPFELQPAAAGTSELRRDYRRPLLTMMMVVGFTLLIACGNIANLLLARAAARRHELSIRTALGASRWRLVRQLFTESLLLSAFAATLGTAIAFWGSRLIVSQLSTDTNRVFLDLGIHWRMLAFTGALTVTTAMIFGIMPALRGTRVAPIEALKEHGRGTSSGRRLGFTGSLVVAQVALSLMLLITAGLFARTFAMQATRDLGFERDRALLVRIDAQRTRLDTQARADLYERIRQTTLALPGVTNAALSFTTPLGDNTLIRLMEFPGRPGLPESERRVHRNFVGSGWFASMGTPLIAGRDFDERDHADAHRTVIVNEAFAEKFFGGRNPIESWIAESPEPGADLNPMQVVGVVGDAVYRSLRQPAPPTMYWPLAQMRSIPTNMTLVVRTATVPPTGPAANIVDAISTLNGDLSLTFRPLSDQVNASFMQERLLAELSGFFGVLALLLAALGLYGITSQAVHQRRIEIGIRMALGTPPARAMRLVLSRVGLLVAAGVLIGVGMSWWAANFIGSLLHGLAPRDPTTIIGAAALLAAVAALAGWLPARRAARIDPAVVLRQGEGT